MSKHELIVIGAGPGGYIAAIRAAQLGLDTACIDENEQLGGTCLRIGCIPSKAMLESSERFHEVQAGLEVHGVKTTGVELDLGAMLKRKDRIVQTLTGGVKSLFKKNRITPYRGRARLDGPGRVIVSQDGDETTLEARHVLIATGSTPATLKGAEPDGDRIGTSTEALSYDPPPKHLVVIGAGAIGMELGAVWKRLGSKVTVLEYLDRILPGMDGEVAREAHKLYEKQGIEFRLGKRVVSAKSQKDRAVVECEGDDPIECERVLVAVGRAPNTRGLGLETTDIKLDKRGFIPVDETYATVAQGVYAIGDVIGGAMLAHKAEHEGVACVEHIVTGYCHVDYDAIPNIVYTNPELACVGRTQEQLDEAGIEYRKGLFPFRANARARTLDQIDGLVKVLTDSRTDRLLGVHILHTRAGDMIGEAAAAIAFAASGEDLARVCHAHPTLCEALHEAALAADGRARNI